MVALPSYVIIDGIGSSIVQSRGIVSSGMESGVRKRRPSFTSPVVRLSCGLLIKGTTNFRQFLEFWDRQMGGGTGTFDLYVPQIGRQLSVYVVGGDIAWNNLGGVYAANVDLEGVL